MRVLIINAQDNNGGGAGKAAYRLHVALLKEGVDSNIIVQNNIIGNKGLQGLVGILSKFVSKIQYKIDDAPVKLYKYRSNTRFSPAWNPFNNTLKKINKFNPDIVHLHWICRGMIRIEDIGQIQAPIVWSLHDMWAFTGGCHYDEACGGYKQRCGDCRVLKSKKENDLSRKVYVRKEKIYSKLHGITIVGLSQWLQNCANESSLFTAKSVFNLPNPIDTEIYRPCDKIKAKQMWEVPEKKKIILFGAMSAIDNSRKGFKEIKGSLCKLHEKNIELIVFGSSKPKDAQQSEFDLRYTGYIMGDTKLVKLYNTADVFVLPTIQDNLPNTIMEALACGIPCVSYNVGGLSDMIKHKENGYLARPFDTDDLARGIDWVFRNNEYGVLSRNARRIVLENFKENIVARKYVRLYKTIMGIRGRVGTCSS